MGGQAKNMVSIMISDAQVVRLRTVRNYIAFMRMAISQ